MDHFSIRVGQSPRVSDHVEVCGTYPHLLAAGKSVTIKCHPQRTARYVSIRMQESNALSVCEVVVYGTVSVGM